MPKLVIKPFLDLDDLKEVKANISANKNDVGPFIIDAQIGELRDLIGDQLFYLMQDDYTVSTKTFATDRFDKLWYGDIWTYNDKPSLFPGLWRMTALYAYARLVNTNKVNVTRYGVKALQDESSEDIEDPRIGKAYRNAMSQAILYAADGARYLQSAKTSGTLIYPEWQKKERKARRSAFSWIPIRRNIIPSAPSISGKGEVSSAPNTNNLPLTLPHTFV